MSLADIYLHFTYTLLLSYRGWIAQAALYLSNIASSYSPFHFHIYVFQVYKCHLLHQLLLSLYCLPHNLQIFQSSTLFAHPLLSLLLEPNSHSQNIYGNDFKLIYPCNVRTLFYCPSYLWNILPMTGNFGGEFILADWRFWEQSANISSAKNFALWCHRYCETIACVLGL